MLQRRRRRERLEPHLLVSRRRASLPRRRPAERQALGQRPPLGDAAKRTGPGGARRQPGRRLPRPDGPAQRHRALRRRAHDEPSHGRDAAAHSGLLRRGHGGQAHAHRRQRPVEQHRDPPLQRPVDRGGPVPIVALGAVGQPDLHRRLAGQSQPADGDHVGGSPGLQQLRLLHVVGHRVSHDGKGLRPRRPARPLGDINGFHPRPVRARAAESRGDGRPQGREGRVHRSRLHADQ